MNLETFVVALGGMAFVWGAIWGSFLNVVIYRLPEGLSLVRPASRCPRCERPLRWHENVPILGWFFVRGRCRGCSVRVSARYPAIELLTAILSVWIWVHVAHGRLELTPEHFSDSLLAATMAFLFYFYFVAILIAITFIDLDRTIIPHELTAAGLVLGVAAAFLIPTGGPMADLWPATQWVDALLGILVGGGVIFGVIKGYALLRGIEGMGWGDFTLMGMIGVWVGWQGIVFVLFAAATQGLAVVLVTAIVSKIRGKRVQDGGLFITDIDAIDLPRDDDPRTATSASAPTPSSDRTPNDAGEDQDDKAFGKLAVPFGPFIAIAAVEYLLLGQVAIPWLLAP